jgi:hypothetical protein
VETLAATRMFKGWVDRGLLDADVSKGKKGTVYRKPTKVQADNLGLFSEADDNRTGDG